MDIKRREFLKLTGLIGIGSVVPFNTEESNPYNLWKPFPPSRLERAESICPLCDSYCKLEILKKRENIFSIINKDKKGLCPKIFAYHNIIYNEGRIKTPLIRKGDKGKVIFNPLDYDRALEILKERFNKDRFHTIAYAKGEGDRYYLSSMSKKISFYQESSLKTFIGADKVYFDIENADLVLNFGGDIVNYGNFIEVSNYLIESGRKVISFSPMVTRGTALGERWIPTNISEIPYLISLITNALSKSPNINYEEVYKRLNINQSDFSELITKIKSSKRVCLTFDSYLTDTVEGMRALISIINLAKNLNSLNKEGGTFFYNNPITSRPFNILTEDIHTLFIYGIDPILTDYYYGLVERLKSIPFIIYMGSHHSEISKYADLILPINFFTEKEELYIKRDKKGFYAMITTPSIEGGVESVELRKKDNIELIFQKILNFKAPFGIKDVSEIAITLDSKLPTRKAYINSSLKSIKISMVSPQIDNKEIIENKEELSFYLYEDNILSFSTRGSKWAEETSNFNRVFINKNLAEKYKIKHGDLIEIKTETKDLKVKCFVMEGIANNTIALRRFKVPADINHYTNRKINFKSKDKEIKYIWWNNEDISLNDISKTQNYGQPLYSCKIISIKKA